MIRGSLRTAATTIRDRVRPWLPSSVLRTLPPDPRLVADLQEIEGNGRLTGQLGIRVLYAHDVVPSSRIQPLLGYPSRWREFEQQPEQTRHRVFLARLQSASVSGVLPAVVSRTGHLVLQPSRTLNEPILTHQTYARLSIGSRTRLRGQTLMLAGGHSGNFYHWVIDTLPRLTTLEAAGIDLSDFDHVLLPEAEGSFIAESLACLPRLAAQRHVLDNTHHFECDELFCPTNPHPYGQITREAVAFIRRLFSLTSNESGSRRLFLSRGQSPRRRLENENEVWTDLLEPAGFSRVHMEDLPLMEQIRLMSTASVVVAPHGAALTHLLFAPQGCQVIELIPDCYPGAVHFWTIASACGHTYRYVVCGSPDGEPNNTVNFRVEPELLQQALRDVDVGMDKPVHALTSGIAGAGAQRGESTSR